MNTLDKFIDNVKKMSASLTCRHSMLISRELKKLSSYSIEHKNVNDEKLVDMQLAISSKLDEYKAFYENRARIYS